MNFFRIDDDFLIRALRIVLGRILMICLMDKIDIATGYLGDCALELQHVLDDLSSRVPRFPKIYVVRNEPWSSQVCTLVFVHRYTEEEREPIQAACN